jgi:hypothetical protein
MATVIDALIMTLGLDTKDFDKGKKGASEDLDKFKKQSGAVAKDVAEGGKKMAQGFTTIRNELIALFAVITAGKGLKNFFTEGVTGMAELGRRATNLGMTARELDAWGGAVESVGGSAEGMQASFQAMASGIEEFKLTGESSIMPLFNALRVQITDGKGNLRSYADVMLDVAEGFKKMTPQDALAFGKRFGMDEHFIYLLQKGKVGVQQLVAEMERQSGVTQKTVEEAQRAQAAWARLDRQFVGLRNTLFTVLEPAIKPLLDRLSRWIDKNRELIASKITEWATRFINWLPTFITHVSHLADKVDDAVKAFGGWKNVALLVGGVLALKVLSPITGLIAGLLRLGPLLLTTSAGLTALAAAGAGIAGWKIGTAFYEKTGYDQTDAARRLGSGVAHVLAFFGNKEAQEAIDREGAAKPLPRGVRNRNPGNLNFAGQRGAHLEAGPNARFAAFDTLQEGIAALVRQLQLYKARGIDTIREIVTTYAPAKDGNNVSAYITELMRATGKNMDDHLDLQNQELLVRLIQGITKHEGNGTLTPDQIMGGVRLSAAYRASNQVNHSSSTSTAETHITGPITIQTQATDAKGIAAGFNNAMSRYPLIANSNSGLN